MSITETHDVAAGATAGPGPRRHEHWINGRARRPAGGGYLTTRNPATRGQGDTIAAGTAADVDLAVTAAAAAWPAWAARPARERSDVLHAVADAIAAATDQLADLEWTSTGKVPGQIAFEIGLSIDYFRYYAGVIRAVHGRTIDLGAGAHAYTRLEPYGVIGVITPWNLPLNQAARAIAPALAVGNALVAKPSEFTSTSTILLASLATGAGLPDGLLNVVTGTGPDVGTPLAAHPAVRKVAFTGSVPTGRHLAKTAGDRLIPLTLELGGKSPVVVFADADLDRAAAAAAAAIQTNSGQVCSATTRLIVEDSVHDEMVAKVVERLERLRPGVDFGPIITEAQFQKVLAAFEDARREGLTPLTGGDAFTEGPGAVGQYIRPTVYADVPATHRLAREEVFGPVLVTRRFAGEDEALAVANDTDYGLVGSVWSGDVARGLRVAERIDAGQIAVNGGPLNNETPFGGYKNSGYGREKGLEALHDYAQTKTISLSLG